MQKRFFLLDADMTLFDFDKAERCAIAQLFREYSIDPTQEKISLYHEINDRLWKSLERGELTQQELRVRRFMQLAEALGRSDLDPERMNLRYSHMLGETCFVFPQAVSLLQNLRYHGKICILTNGITQVQRRRMALSGLWEYTNALVISQEVGYSKPDPRIVEIALQRLGCIDRREALLVGDSLSSDMLAAKNAQVEAVLFDPKDRPLPLDNPFIIGKITQLHELTQYI